MATVNQEIHQKFKKLTTVRQEADGHENKVEVREDEEQSVKLQEIIDLLVAAGYFRARIKGLSPFDKVVGGMTWCIESCNVDIDVDLLFQENSTIGQKISLTEKIVAVLPKMKCPHRIEPHQIQGLDFIHIFPVIQWLVKRSMEFREEMSAFVRSYAVNQFTKHFPLKNVKAEVQKKVLDNVNTVTEVYRPRRYYKRKNTLPDDISARVQITLLEYGRHGVLNNTQTKSIETDILGDQQSQELQFEQLMTNMAAMNENSLEYSTLSEIELEKISQHYAQLKSEMKDGGVKSKEERQLIAMEKRKLFFEEHSSKLQEEKEHLLKEIAECRVTIQQVEKKQEEAAQSLQEMEQSINSDLNNTKDIEELIKLNDSLRSQEIKFREQCKIELAQLQSKIQEAKQLTPEENHPEDSKELEEETEKLRILRLHVAKKNRVVSILQRQLDGIPTRPELAQYQRRFLELYNQVAAKHKETKQYFTLYNTLEDTKFYMSKELSILNSISENYPEAMQSGSSKEDFLKQFENIVEGVKHSKFKLESKLAEEKHKRDQLSLKLKGLVEQQRHYVAAVRQLGIEYKKHEALLAQSNNNT